ncbi:MAG: metal-dependent hydrolase [Pseudomonadales bacterium]
MDPISQGAIGAAFAQSASTHRRLGWIALFGCIGGLAPDLDVFITSRTDPLLFLEYHRQFSHSLIFIPIGAFAVSTLLGALFRHPLSRLQAFGAAFAGYATHGLLDACTSYGTQLFWPFSDQRISWNNVSVVDPLFTLPVLGLTLWGIWRKRRGFAVLAMAWGLAYLVVGVLQHARVRDASLALAQTRAHAPQDLLVKPAFGNLLLWKSVYRYDGRYYVDGHRAGPEVTHCQGDHIAVLDIARDLPSLDPNSQQARDLERFRWFSMGYLARFDHALPGRSAEASELIVDVRYSNLPNTIAPMWGIELNANGDPQTHVRWWASRSLSAAGRTEFAALLDGEKCMNYQTFAELAHD